MRELDAVRGKRASLTRRRWLGAAAALAIGPAWPGLAPAADKDRARLTEDDTKARQEVEAKAEEAKLNGFETSVSAHYLAIGNAPEAFRDGALRICERLQNAYLHHFQFKRYAVGPPKKRMVVVALDGPASFEAFSGLQAAPGVGGYYDRETNRLVVLDNRAADHDSVDLAERANLVSLVHEATHQLTYNTGLLNRKGDVPVCISEGLATYAELWRPRRTVGLGQDNVGRRQGLRVARDAGVTWVPVSKLLTGDALFEGGGGGDATLQLVYAESWVLAYEMMTKLSWDKPFHAYLKAIAGREDASHRLEDAAEHFGDLDELDKSLRRTARWIGR